VKVEVTLRDPWGWARVVRGDVDDVADVRGSAWLTLRGPEVRSTPVAGVAWTPLEVDVAWIPAANVAGVKPA
jgi:hypothetical protein